ncbi:MAG: NAD(+) synthase [Bacteroidales bacterium]
MRYGFLKTAAAIPRVKVADCRYNAARIEALLSLAVAEETEVVVFPELAITAYTCADLFFQSELISGAEIALENLLNHNKSHGPLVFVGMPVKKGNALYNAAVAFQGNRILAVIPKTHLPNYGEFYEKRWFTPADPNNLSEITLCGQSVPFGTSLLFTSGEVVIGVEICEDLWMPIPPSSYQAMAGANLLINLSASNDVVGKYRYVQNLVTQQSARCMAGYLYVSAGTGESTTDLVFGGKALAAENGIMVAEAARFESRDQLLPAEIDIEKVLLERRRHTGFSSPTPPMNFISIPFARKASFKQLPQPKVNPTPFVPSGENRNPRCAEIMAIQATGLQKRLLHTGCSKVVVGLSGGLDSTLALLVSIQAFALAGLPIEGIIAITMPGFGTTSRTYNNAVNLAKTLGVTLREISIKAACLQHFSDIGHNPEVHDVTYENSQARERTQILMDLANREQALVIGTGDLSELALGWATYNGDHMSMYGVNAGVPKTLVRHMIAWKAAESNPEVATLLADILDTPVSPELLPAGKEGAMTQKTEELVGPYLLHDFFLYQTLRFGFGPAKTHFLATLAFEGTYTPQEIQKWMNLFYKRFFSQQFKRSCMPDGPKVGSVNLSPRGDWRMPSDAESTLWQMD